MFTQIACSVVLLLLLQGTTTDAGDGTKLSPASVNYTLWIGDNVTTVETIRVWVFPRLSFYNVMRIAAFRDSRFCFQATYNSVYGHYITSISGVKQNTETNDYWMIYKLPGPPDVSAPPPDDLLSEVGVDSIRVEDGDNYLFWYKHVNLTSE